MKDLKWAVIGSIITLLIYGIFNTFNLEIRNIDDVLSSAFNNNKAEKELVIASPNDPMGLDPATVTDNESFKVTVNIYENLVKYDTKGNNIIPALAEDWSMSEDGLVWQFKIRKGVHFHNGELLDAEAVAFNFTRWMDENSTYHTGNFSYWNMSFGGFPGIVKQVTALSSNTLEIRLSKPYSPFLSTLTMPAFAIASPEAIKGFNEELRKHPVGTGPYIFEKWEKDSTVTIRKNDNYWGEKARIDKVKFIAVESKPERLRLLREGKVHVIDVLTKSQMKAIKETEGLSLIGRPYFNIGCLSLNMKNKVLADINIRKAIAHSLDRDKMMAIAYDELSKSANSFLPPVIWGHNEKIKALPYNIRDAKVYMKKSGYDEGVKLNLLVMNTPRKYFPRPVYLAEFIKDSLERVGIEVNVEVTTWEEVIRRRNKGDYDMVLAGWNGDIVDPDNFLYTMFSSDNLKSGLSNNYSFYRDAKVDALLGQARQATDMTFRDSLYREVQEEIHNDVPSIPLAHTMTFIGISDKVTNYYPNINGSEVLNMVDIKDGD